MILNIIIYRSLIVVELVTLAYIPFPCWVATFILHPMESSIYVIIKASNMSNTTTTVSLVGLWAERTVHDLIRQTWQSSKFYCATSTSYIWIPSEERSKNITDPFIKYIVRNNLFYYCDDDVVAAWTISVVPLCW